MKNLFILFLFITTHALAKTITMPQGKGKCPPFTFEVDEGWTIKSDRKKGDRWQLLDETNRVIARFDFDLSSTDMKMQMIIEDQEVKLGDFIVNKTSVGSKKIMTTAYYYTTGKLNKLTVFSFNEEVNNNKKVEEILSSIKLKKN